MLVTQSGQANLPLGVFAQAQYDQGEVPVHPRDRILLYTDGLSEAMSPNSDEEFADKQMLALLEAEADDALARVRD